VIRYQGQEYDDYNVEQAGIEELRQVKAKLGLTVRQLLAGTAEIDVDAMTAVRWIVRRQRDQRLVLDAGEKYDYWEWANAYLASRVAAQAQEEDPDPTTAGSLPAGPTPESTASSTPTPVSSPESTASPSPAGATSPSGTSDDSPSPDSSGT